jgi:hypothetical protein
MALRIYNKIDNDYVCSVCFKQVSVIETKCSNCKTRIVGFSNNNQTITVSKKADNYIDELEKILGKIEQELICPKCKAEQKNKDAVFCIKCGESLFSKKIIEVKQCPECKSNFGSNDAFCDKDGKKLINKKIEIEDKSNPNYKIINLKKPKKKKISSAEQLPMKWYKFIIYVSMPLGAISLLLWMFFLSQFDSDFYDFSFFLFLLFIVQLINWYGLYKKFNWSWKLYIGLLILTVFIQSIDYAVQLDSFISFFIFMLVLISLLVYPQYLYFKKRNHLFVD